jgi:hypothetical protein
MQFIFIGGEIVPRVAVFADIPPAVYEKLPLNERGELDLTANGLLEIAGLVLREHGNKRVVAWIPLVQKVLEQGGDEGHPLVKFLLKSGFSKASQLLSPNVVSLGLSTMQLAAIEAKLGEISRKIDDLAREVKDIKDILKREQTAQMNHAISVVLRAEKTKKAASRDQELLDTKKTLGQIQENLLLEIEDILKASQADRYPDLAKLALLNQLMMKVVYLLPYLVRCWELLGEPEQIAQEMNAILERFQALTLQLVDYSLSRLPTPILFYKETPKETRDQYIALRRWRACPEDMLSVSSFDILQAMIAENANSFWDLTSLVDDVHQAATILRGAAKAAPLPLLYWNNAVAQEGGQKAQLVQAVVDVAGQAVENLRRLQGYDLEVTALQYRNWDQLSVDGDTTLEQAILERLQGQPAGLVMDVDAAAELGIDVEALGAEIFEV